jgi:hypothetical protein
VTTEQWRQLGLGGITVLFLGGAAYVLWPEPTPPKRPAPVEARPPARSEPAPVASLPAPEPIREAPTPQPQPPPPPQPPAEATSTPELPMDPRERLKALEPLGREVFAGLRDLDGRVEACRLRDASLRLTLETLDGQVRVLRVRVVPLGAATEEATGVAPLPLDEGAASCVRGALERTILSAPSARPGRQWEMAWWPGANPWPVRP